MATLIRPPVKETLVTVPAPAGAAQTPSPRQKVEEEALVPELRFVTGRFPVTPVERGRPVALMSEPLEGVPRVPPLTTNAPAEPTPTPSAVTTPDPVVIVEGAAPTPPPTTKLLEASMADVFHDDDESKYGMPPEVPATVSASVPAVVIGDPETEIKPPVKVWAMEVTVPPPPDVATQLVLPEPSV